MCVTARFLDLPPDPRSLHNPTSILASGGLGFPIPTFFHPLRPLDPKGGFTPPLYASPGAQSGGADASRTFTFLFFVGVIALCFLFLFCDPLFSIFWVYFGFILALFLGVFLVLLERYWEHRFTIPWALFEGGNSKGVL